MPFAVPSVRGCRLQARQRVRTTGAEVTFEHVLATLMDGATASSRTCRPASMGGCGTASSWRDRAEEASGRYLWWHTKTLGGQQPVQWRATERQVAVKCIERSKYEQHVARHRGQLNEDPIKEVAVMEYIVPGRRALMSYLYWLLMLTSKQCTSFYPSAQTGISSGQ